MRIVKNVHFQTFGLRYVRLMDLLPFSVLAPYRPRHFLSQDLDLANWSQIAPWFDLLETRAAAIRTRAELEEWVLDWSEMSAAAEEESARRYIAMTCHTDNAAAQEAYLHFLEKVEPELKRRQFKLAQLYITHPVLEQLPDERYRVFTRDTR